MLLGCPTCKTRYRLDDSRIQAEGIHLQCCRCRTVFRVGGKTPQQFRALAERSPGQSDKPVTVLVANESPDFCASVAHILSSEPITVLCCHDGKEAMDLIEEHRPDVVLLDVALPTLYGFEICETIRNTPALSAVKTILIASIYDKTRYKREPQSLYGADDYIEKHHIPDSLSAKIYRLVFGQKTVDQDLDDSSLAEEEKPTDLEDMSEQEMVAQELVREELRRDEEAKTSSRESLQDSDAHYKARRLARIIVTDIALYNQKKIEEAVRNGTFYELFEEELNDGRIFYNRRIAEQVREGTRYLEDAVADFIFQKKSDLDCCAGDETDL
ncbi:MAG: response regulator [Deltaproteobacteria bacterium]|nr:response regulator [Deltaproteobacteria bacterium]TLN05175.1 MAG: response regulator [bacterium]